MPFDNATPPGPPDDDHHRRWVEAMTAALLADPAFKRMLELAITAFFELRGVKVRWSQPDAPSADGPPS